ncbi:hypothetical protein EVAR_52613_1 [Eumeta japonica]|uniref:Uncharacterized protein n=1 Tax=Eumeta variegata TaxID=151549 RepID=A0A4C1YPW1_EUMVA|nr:hypothetical protein EVAR_52613_1 [Eumeta japonica]
MFIRKPRGISSALPASWVGIGHLIEGEWADGRKNGVIEGGRWSSEIPFARRNARAESVSTRLYPVEVWYLTSPAGHCKLQVFNSVILLGFILHKRVLSFPYLGMTFRNLYILDLADEAIPRWLIAGWALLTHKCCQRLISKFALGSRPDRVTLKQRVISSNVATEVEEDEFNSRWERLPLSF